MSTKNVGLYIVGHGPYRKPRFIEMQYLRLIRYLNELNSLENDYFDLKEKYIDINFPRKDGFISDFPALEKLLADIKKDKIQLVLIDIEVGEFNKYSPIINTIENTNVELYNCYYDDRNIMKNKLENMYGDIVSNQPLPNDDEEFLALFPAFTARIFSRILLDEHIDFTEKIYRIINHLKNKNPYIRDALPWLTNRKQRDIINLKTKEENNRRKKETLYKLNPNDNGRLKDEFLHGGNPREKTEWEWAEERLNNLKFSKEKTNKIISYVRKFDEYIIYADPRANGRINFQVYKKQNNSYSYIGDFYLLDSWYKNLEDKLLKRMKKIINQ